MRDLWGNISNHIDIGGVIATFLALAFLALFRLFLVNVIRGKREILDKAQRRWINRINNTSFVFGFIILIFIWAPQLHTFALSLTAVAVAIVITTKELLMCLTGGFLRTATKPFDIGHWISIDGVTGEVMSVNALSVVIQEVDTSPVHTFQFTGRTIQIPNSKFLNTNVENNNFFKHYIYQDIPIAVQYADIDPAKLMMKLEELTEQYFSPYKNDALAFNKKVEKRSAVDFADPNPQYFLKTTDLGHKIFTVRVFLPTAEAARISSSIVQDFLSYLYGEVQEIENAKNKK